MLLKDKTLYEEEFELGLEKHRIAKCRNMKMRETMIIHQIYMGNGKWPSLTELHGMESNDMCIKRRQCMRNRKCKNNLDFYSASNGTSPNALCGTNLRE